MDRPESHGDAGDAGSLRSRHGAGGKLVYCVFPTTCSTSKEKLVDDCDCSKEMLSRSKESKKSKEKKDSVALLKAKKRSEGSKECNCSKASFRSKGSKSKVAPATCARAKKDTCGAHSKALCENCGRCLCIFCQWLLELVKMLLTCHSEQRFRQMCCDIMTMTGCIGHDFYCMLKSLLMMCCCVRNKSK